MICLSAPTFRVQEFASWRTRPDLDWIPTPDTRSALEDLYERHLREGLRSFLQPNLEGMFSPEPAEDAERATKFIPAEMREAWQTRVDELDTLGDAD